MPSKSQAQANLMRAAASQSTAHGWKKPGAPAPGAGGPSPAVAKEFMMADRLRSGNTGSGHHSSHLGKSRGY